MINKKRKIGNIVINLTVQFTTISNMNKTQIAMTNEQWQTVIDAVNDKYPDSDCMDILINNVPYFPSIFNNENI